MTTFQDPQPQSRRAARQSERGESPEQTPGFTEFPLESSPADSDAAEQPAYQVRDFSPVGRRASSAVPDAAPASPHAAPISAVPSHAAPVWMPPAVVAPEVVSEVPKQLVDSGHPHTLTRRELRALQQAQEHPVAVTAPPAFAAEPTPTPTPTPTLSDEPQAWPFAGLRADPTAPDVTAPDVMDEPIESVAATIAPQSVEPIAAGSGPVPPAADFVPARAVEAPPASQWTAPLGHWSNQAGLDDESQPYESTINRMVGSGTVTTSALVLGAIPDGSDIRGPLTGNGEIVLTGSIDLPHTFAATGATGRVENSGIDALFDMHDAEVVTTDSQPVRAISAVSTHNSGQGVTHTQKPKGTKALTALVISAASLAVVVVGLLIAVFALKLF